MVRAVLVCLLVWVIAATLPSPALAQAVRVGEPLSACVRPADRSAAIRTLMASPALFDCVRPQRSFGAGDFDVLSGPLPPRAGQNWPGAIRTASLLQDRVTLYALYADGAMAVITSDGRDASRRMQLGAVVETRLPVRGVPVVRLMWRVEGAANVRGILRAARIARPSESARSNLLMGAIYAGFGGLCLALLVGNMALWVALRHRFQLAYAAMIMSLMVLALSGSGALAWLDPGIANNDRIRVNYLMLALSAVSAQLFARTFFEPRIFAGWLGRYATASSVAVLASAALFAALAPWQAILLDRIYAATFVILLIGVVPVLWRAWRLRSNYLWLFAIAWATPIAIATARIIGHITPLRGSVWLENSAVLAMTAEALLSSLAIAYRIHLLSRERDEAREREMAAHVLADTDPLTGLLNRRAFLSRAIGRAGEQALLVVDLDHFKQVNETIGHDGGDEVLRAIAQALVAAAPADALVARIGGEEFAMIVDAAAKPSAHRLLDRLRSVTLPYDLMVTASIGTCVGPLARETDWKRLYRRADEALFAAKAAGRDRVRDAAPIPLAA
jgi:diguanylate cyclase (GGDEF)-like protein